MLLRNRFDFRLQVRLLAPLLIKHPTKRHAPVEGGVREQYAIPATMIRGMFGHLLEGVFAQAQGRVKEELGALLGGARGGNARSVLTVCDAFVRAKPASKPLTRVSPSSHARLGNVFHMPGIDTDEAFTIRIEAENLTSMQAGMLFLLFREMLRAHLTIGGHATWGSGRLALTGLETEVHTYRTDGLVQFGDGVMRSFDGPGWRRERPWGYDTFVMPDLDGGMGWLSFGLDRIRTEMGGRTEANG